MTSEVDRLLDCSSKANALRSVSGVLGVAADILRSRWGTLRIEDPNYKDVAPENRLLFHLGYDPDALPQPAAIRWFHATRAVPGTEFRDGLLPTMRALPLLWAALEGVVMQRAWMSIADWQQFRDTFWQSDTFGARQFSQKLRLTGWEGPFAFLVRDAAVNGDDAGHRDFTTLSEAAEDIGLAFEERFALPLRDAIREDFRPCLVVFTRPGNWPGAVRAALNYVFRADRGISQDLDSNANFSGEGQAVPPSWIDRVEWL